MSEANPPQSPSTLRAAWDDGRRSEVMRSIAENPRQVEEGARSLGWLVQPLLDHGLDSLGFRLLVAATAARDGTAGDWLPVIESLRQSGDPWWAEELTSRASSRSRELDEVEIELALGLGGDAGDRIERWLESYDDDAAVDRALAWYAAAGSIEKAEALLPRAGPGSLWPARLALWRDDLEAARGLLAKGHDTPEHRLLRAIAAVRAGDFDDARARLVDLVDEGRSGNFLCEVWSWLATVHRQLGDYDQARVAADNANRASPELTVAPRLERELAVELALGPEAEGGWWSRLWRRQRPPRKVGELEYAAQLEPFGVDASEAVVPALEGVIDSLAGNRTPATTTWIDGRLRRARPRPDPRHVGASIQRVLWTRGVEAVRQLFDNGDTRVTRHPLARIYQGEVELWVGNYARAEAIFREVLGEQRRTLWAWIGLGATRMFQDDLDDALSIWREGVEVMSFEGPTLFIFRGECHRRRGAIEAARADLETAIRQKPQRLSAWINLALLERDASAIEQAIERCRTFAPLLMEQLDGTPEEQLEGVLAAMRGNRSSSPDLMCYQLWGQTWRRARAADGGDDAGGGDR